MQQYKIEFFDRQLNYVFHDTTADLSIDDDYLSVATNMVEIKSTDAIKAGHFIRISRDDDLVHFFGIVSDVSPGEYITTIRYKPFVSLFDEDILFDTTVQGTGNNKPDSSTLENVIKKYITDYYIANDDTFQNFPMTVSVPAIGSHTRKWSMNLKSDTEGASRTIIGFHSVLITNAMKQYGIAIIAEPNFSLKRIELTISKCSDKFQIDGDLDNIKVKTLKVNDRPDGVNKLTVYNTENYNQFYSFYVHTNRTWDDNGLSDRIVPVVRDIKDATPDTELAQTDYNAAFAYAALEVAYSELSGLTWDNLIELECMPSDPIVRPLEMKFGQTIILHYSGGTYESILTGISVDREVITLTFGSERIRFTKNRKKNRT